ncbi:MAG: tail fiber protein [Proteobacteria bacterium]|nr:tail fiber protein [Pseudomonadota bacterium]MBU1640064.1 tail fiber protein [Pseudomonadota bacterium]
MQFPGFLLTKQGQSLLAKVQAGAVLNFTKAATGAGQPPPDNAPFSAVATSTVVTVDRTETGAAAGADVNTGFTLVEVTPGGVGLAEVTSITCLAAATLSGGEYFTITSPRLAFYVWITVDGVGADPTPANAIGLQVDVAALDSDATVAQKLATAMDHFRLDLSDLFALIDPRQELAIQTITRVDDVVSEIATILSNAELVAGYYLCELGVFAMDPDDGEILYAVTNAGLLGDYFPAEGGTTLIEADLRMRTTISADAALSMSMTPGAWASLASFTADQQERSHKEPCRAATTADIVLSGLQTVDGVVLVTTDRVLVKTQNLSAENGIYLAAAGAWTRAVDADSIAKIKPGMLVAVVEGTIHADSVWMLATDGVIVLDTTPLVFFDFSKHYIDTHDTDPTAHAEMRQHQALKDAVLVATTANIALTGEQTIDGVAVVAGDAVLVKEQTAGAENGIYLAATGAWARREDADAPAKLITRMMVPVRSGDKNKNSIWWLIITGTIVLGTTALTFAEPFSGLPAGAILDNPSGVVPPGFLECNGAAISRTAYVDMFSNSPIAIGTMYGVGNGSTTFNVPDRRGKFVRGWDHGAGVDPDAASRTNRGDGTTGNNVGTSQADGFKSHAHNYTAFSSSGPDSAAGAVGYYGNYTAATVAAGGNETRPLNVYTMYIIKY